jgi:D-3-phosphoglycerate dehydrogenase
VLDRIQVTDEQSGRLSALAGSPESVRLWHGEENPDGADEVIRRIGTSEYVLTSWTDFPRELVLSLPTSVKLLSVVATSYAWVDVASARERGIAVTNVPGYARFSVSELVFGFILELARNIGKARMRVRSGDFSRESLPLGTELYGKTIGIIGTGSIGSRVVRIASGFGMNVLATTLEPSPERAAALGVTYTNLASLLAASDFVTVHVPATPETAGMIGDEQFRQMKRGAYFIFTSRPGVCDEDALVRALQAGHLAGAALDETSESAHTPGSPLLQMENVVVSPEIGFYTTEAVSRMTDIAIANVESFAAGSPQNIVN